MNTVFVVGSLNIDQTIRVPAFPRAGETIQGSDAAFSPGGKGANQAVAASRAAAGVRLVGRVGQDGHGAVILEALAQSNVDSSHVTPTYSASTGTAVIAVDDLGENQIILSPGANATLSTADVDAGLATMTANDVLVLQLEIPREIVRHAALLATLRGAFVILNAAPSPHEIEGLFDDIDLLVVNEQEIQDLAHLAGASGDLADLTEILPPVLGPTVLCTAGAQGAVTFLDGRHVHIPAPEVSVTDTTAAGDTFVGYLAATLAVGSELPAAMAVAGRAAAIAVTRPGAVESIPWRHELPAPHDHEHKSPPTLLSRSHMKIALGNDHAGFPLKGFVRSVLEGLGHEVIDRGAPDESPVDFPDITRATCELVLTGEADKAVLVCGTGVGAVMAANKIPGIRCALGHDVYSAHQSVEHDDANVIAMGAWLIGRATAKEVLEAFLVAKFDDDEDTKRRVAKLRELELLGARKLAQEI